MFFGKICLSVGFDRVLDIEYVKSLVFFVKQIYEKLDFGRNEGEGCPEGLESTRSAEF